MLGDPKTVFEPYPDPKNSPLGSQKVNKSETLKDATEGKFEQYKFILSIQK